MCRKGAVWGLCGVVVACCAIGSGCRTEEPPDRYAGDVAEEGEPPLLPTNATFKNPGIADGQADWIDFREVSDEDPDAAQPAGDGGADAAELEAEIREIIDEYNGVVTDAEEPVEEWLGYYVEEQLDALEPIFEVALTAVETLQELETSLREKKPDEAQRSGEVVAALRNRLPATLVFESMSVASDEEVTVTLAPGSLIPMCRFVVLDDAWYIEVSDADALPQTKATLDTLLTTYRGWVESLNGGQATPEEVLGQVAAAAQPPAVAPAPEGG